MAKGILNRLMVINIKDNGKMIKNKEMAPLHGQMETLMKDIGKMIKNKEKGYLHF